MQASDKLRHYSICRCRQNGCMKTDQCLFNSERRMTVMAKLYEVVVVGGGLAGICAALAAADAGYKTAIIAPKSGVPDGRTTALMTPSIALLEKLQIWQRVRDVAAPLRTMRIIDGTNRLLRAPTVSFQSSELDLEAFGYNIPNAPLLDALHGMLIERESIDCYHKQVESVEDRPNQATLYLAGGLEIGALIVAAADGRNSLIRRTVGIGIRDWQYRQTALVMNLAHEYGHADTSNEFHTEDGPFTQVPLPGNRSSLVWAMNPGRAEAMAQLPAAALALEVESRMDSILGKITIDSSVQSFPFSGMIASAFAKGRFMLIGEAGHVFPPIGAQGLNLGLRDVVDFVDVIRSTGGHIDSDRIARHYNRLRRSDVTSRTFGVDMLNRSLLSGFLPVQLARTGGLSLLSRIAPLRQLAMREGISPGSGFRKLARRQEPI